MIAWIAPWALAGVFLLGGPVLVHMLLRRNARRVVFPTTRFLPRTRASAVRFRRPSDIGLLILRCAIVLAAVAAAAQPLMLGAWRARAWNGRIARAVVLDTSRSMQAFGDGGRLAEQEMTTFAKARFEGADLRDAIRRAVDWVASAAPARREIVVISDFQRGSLDVEFIHEIPMNVGLRFIRAGTHPATRDVPLPAISGWRDSEWQPTAMIRGDAVETAWFRRGPSSVGWIETRTAPGDEEAARRALHGAASLGIAQPEDGRRAIVVFAGAAPLANARTVATEWMLRAELALRQSRLLRQTGSAITTAELGNGFVVHVNVSAADPMAPAVVRAVMLAVSPASVADRELEVATVADADLAAWQREPGPIESLTTVPRSIGSDARWLWAAALGLLGIESLLRNRRTDPRKAEEVTADAA